MLYALGDIHGAARALEQVLERSDFNKEEDHLVFLGDIADGYPETRRAVDILLDIPNLYAIMGNHDEWARNWMCLGRQPIAWTTQGGQATIQSYHRASDTFGNRVPESHLQFFKSMAPYYEEDGRVFVHGGIPVNFMDGWRQAYDAHDLAWDRTLVASAFEKDKVRLPDNVHEVYVGHTSTTYLGDTDQPMHKNGVWNLDTGAGHGDRLTLMRVYDNEYWQSDPTEELYPNYEVFR